MDNDAILMKLGELSGKLDGMGREIGDIKDMIGNNEKGLCGRLSTLEVHGARVSQENAADIVIIRDKINHLESKQNATEKVEVAKVHWTDSLYVKIGALFTFVGTVIGLIVGIAAYLR
jgi:hypothetical protein